MQLGVKAFSSRPFGIAPHRGIDGEAAEPGHADLSFHGRSDHKGTDTHGQLAQLYIRPFDRNGIIGSGGNTHTTAYAFTLDTGNDEFRTLAHGIDEVGKT